MTTRPATQNGIAGLVVPFVLLVALWLATRPFFGIYHDATLYTAQALLRLPNDGLRADPAFAFGTQDGFSIFSALYAPLIDALGVGRGHATMAFACQAAWLGALLALARALTATRGQAFLVAAMVVALDPVFGPAPLFTYGEGFATARPLAEALVMVALALALPALAGRTPWGWRAAAIATALALAALLHPLVTLPGIGVLGILLALRFRWLWLVAAAGVAAGVLLALGGVEPFVRLLQRFDAEWMGIVLARTTYGAIGQWKPGDWFGLALQLSVLAVAWRLAALHERRAIAAIAAVGLGGLAVAWLGGDIAENVLVFGLQTWRALWLLAVAANAWAAVILLRLPAGSLGRELLAVGLACAVAERFGLFGDLFSPALILPGLAVAWHEARRGALVGRAVRLGARMLCATVVALVAVALVFAVIGRASIPFAAESWGAALAAGAALALVAARLAWNPGRWAGLAAAGAVLALALWSHDRRSDWTRFVEDTRADAAIAAFAGDGLAYWENGLTLQWLKLRRPAGFGCYQGAGLVFFRGMAIEFRRRYEALGGLDTIDFERQRGQVCPPRRNPDREGPETVEQLTEACRALPELDALILVRPVPGAAGTTWQAPAEMVRHQIYAVPVTRRFHRYDCAALR